MQVPDQITNGQNYLMQFGHHLSFAGAGNLATVARVVSQSYASVTMNALVTNVGVGGPTTVTVSLGGQSVFTASQVITGPTTLSVPNFATALNAYVASRPVNASVDVPISVTVDRAADVILTNLALTPGSGVDLAVAPADLALGCPGASGCRASEGDTISISVAVHNQGVQAASAAVVSYYVGDPQVGGRLLGNSFVPSIAAGSVATATLAWPTQGFTHTQTLYAVVDPPNAIAESDETNNVVSQTLYIKTKPNLRVAALTFPADRVAGEALAVTVVVSNTGETDAQTTTTRVQLLGERDDLLTSDIPTGVVAATGTITVSTVLTPTVFGSHAITVTADAAGSVGESNEGDNVMTATISTGLGPQAIDAGSAADPAYTPQLGYGYLNGSAYDFGQTSSTMTSTVRFDDGAGVVQYRFDGLQPGRAYHLDGAFYQEGDTFTETVAFNGIDGGQVIPMNDGQASRASFLAPASAYTSTVLTVTVQRADAGPVFVSGLALNPVAYTYIDAGSAGDVAYSAARGFGYLGPTNGGTSTYASSLGGIMALNSYRSSFGKTVSYRFDSLNPAKSYLADVTMYDGPSSTRVQTVTVDGSNATGCTALAVNQVRRVQCVIPQSSYLSDSSVVVAVACGTCSGPRVNEIALEEDTRTLVVPAPSATSTPSSTPSSTATSTPSSTPSSTVTTTPSPTATTTKTATGTTTKTATAMGTPTRTATTVSTVTGVPGNTSTATGTPLPGAGRATNAGGGAVGAFVADVGYTGGATGTVTATISISGVTNPAPQAVYQSARVGSVFTYTVASLTPSASYLVRLHFAELVFMTTNSRVFSVTINGTQVLTNFDLVAVTGGKDIATVRQFTVPADGSGKLVVGFKSTVGNALLSGLEILP